MGTMFVVEVELCISCQAIPVDKTLISITSPQIATTGISDLSQRWPNGVMYYEIDHKTITPEIMSNIKEAMNMWSSRTCITFVPRQSEEAYVYITSGGKGTGCYSNHVGYKGHKQDINIEDPGCTMKGTIAHELGHNLGLWHEHTRPDRDDYVVVNENNVKSEDIVNFVKRKVGTVNLQGLDYDFDSIMHYRSNAFTKNGKDTIVVKDTVTFEKEGSPSMGQRDHLSAGDVATINRLYKCPGYEN